MTRWRRHRCGGNCRECRAWKAAVDKVGGDPAALSVWVAECRDCAAGTLAATFRTPSARNAWAVEHAAVLGHTVTTRHFPRPPRIDYPEAPHG